MQILYIDIYKSFKKITVLLNKIFKHNISTKLMKTLRYTFLAFFTISALLFFQNCKKDSVNPIEKNTNKLRAKTQWTVSSVNVPINSATLGSDWANFTVSFTETNMTTSGFPTGAQAVWPSGTYEISADGTIITRQDGVVMTLNPITETNFTASFSLDEGTVLGGRLAALDGDYIFNMQ